MAKTIQMKNGIGSIPTIGLGTWTLHGVQVLTNYILFNKYESRILLLDTNMGKKGSGVLPFN